MVNSGAGARQIGFVSFFLVVRHAGIGFVSRIWVVGMFYLFGIAFGDGALAGPSALGRCASLRSPPLGMPRGGGNWVRFAYLGMAKPAKCRWRCKLGSFCGNRGRWGEIGFVSFVLVVGWRPDGAGG